MTDRKAGERVSEERVSEWPFELEHTQVVARGKCNVRAVGHHELAAIIPVRKQLCLRGAAAPAPPAMGVEIGECSEGLLTEEPSIVGCIVPSALDDSAHNELVDEAQRLLRLSRQTVRGLRLLKAVVHREPLCVREVDLRV